ncbi:MAG: RNA-binding S4 domain-containing protein [Streptococcaceae bacterium]|jgi:ribosomal 50S subunit-recycling heat shock protein|nr:RNA-binding S4 domain-containing protein [Streptococcaceae bacterium]
MRLDKFLKVSRLIKRRPVAKEIVDKGRVQVNGKLAKAGVQLKLDDVIRIRFGNKIVEAKVLLLSENARKEEAERMYEILSEERIDGDGPRDD